MDIDFIEIGISALRVLGIGLLFGAGLPMLFALGMRMQAIGRGDSGDEAADGTATIGRGNPAATAVAYLLYAVVVAAVIVGVLFVTRHTLDHYFGISLFGG